MEIALFYMSIFAGMFFYYGYTNSDSYKFNKIRELQKKNAVISNVSSKVYKRLIDELSFHGTPTKQSIEMWKFYDYYSQLCSAKECELILDENNTLVEISEIVNSSPVCRFIENIVERKKLEDCSLKYDDFGMTSVIHAALCIIQDFSCASSLDEDRLLNDRNKTLAHIQNDFDEMRLLAKPVINALTQANKPKLPTVGFDYKKGIYNQNGSYFGNAKVTIRMHEGMIWFCAFKFFHPYDLFFFHLENKNNVLHISVTTEEGVEKRHMMGEFLNEFIQDLAKIRSIDIKVVIDDVEIENLEKYYGGTKNTVR